MTADERLSERIQVSLTVAEYRYIERLALEQFAPTSLSAIARRLIQLGGEALEAASDG